MSELEKQQRDAYQKERNRQITLRSIVTAVLVVALLISGTFAHKLSQNTFVTYTESGTADYQVYLNSNRFYDEEYLDQNHAYIAALMNNIQVNFSYSLHASAGEAEYSYTSFVDARLEIVDRDSGAAVYDPVYVLEAPETFTVSRPELMLEKKVNIDYHKYNNIAREFISTYGLDDAKCTLVVTFHVNVAGTCPEVPADQGEYTVALRIPLNRATLKIETDTTVPGLEPKVLACDNGPATVMTVLTWALAAAAAVSLFLLVRYIIVTRDRHINYARRVRKILSSYRSYIQQIQTPFDTAGYQVLELTSFEELLEIRDTLRMPILMHEDSDKTCSQFLLPTATGLCYLYRVSVVGTYQQVG